MHVGVACKSASRGGLWQAAPIDQLSVERSMACAGAGAEIADAIPIVIGGTITGIS